MTAWDVKREMDRQRKILHELGTMHRSHCIKPKASFAAEVTRRPFSFWSTETEFVRQGVQEEACASKQKTLKKRHVPIMATTVSTGHLDCVGK